MKKSAAVKFVGDQNNYKLGCSRTGYAFCRDCKRCAGSNRYLFVYGHLYNAYFLEFWQGNRTSLHIKGEDGEITDFIPFEDFEVIADEDDVLNLNEAAVRCNTHSFEGEPFADLSFGKEYKAIGFNKDNQLLVMDNSLDCYFYPRSFFDVISDPQSVLNTKRNMPVYDWSNTHIDTVTMRSRVCKKSTKDCD